MYENEGENNEIFSKALRAGRRTYFFDIRGTKAGDYYLTITESKKFTHEDGSSHYQKHKIYLYKEDFNMFKEILDEMTNYVFDDIRRISRKNLPLIRIILLSQLALKIFSQTKQKSNNFLLLFCFIF